MMNRMIPAIAALAAAALAPRPALALANHTMADVAVADIVVTDLGSTVQYDVEYENVRDDAAYNVTLTFSTGVNPGAFTIQVLSVESGEPTPVCQQFVTPNNYLRVGSCAVTHMNPGRSVWIRYVVPVSSPVNAGASIFSLTPEGDEDGNSLSDDNYLEYVP